MVMTIQDNLNGALLISAIDFILSFVIIGGIGVILAMFPLLNRFSSQEARSSASIPLQHPTLKGSDQAAISAANGPPTISAATVSIHPGLSDQELVVLLTAAASEAMGGSVRIERFRPLTDKDGSWTVQGRQILQSHRLK